MSDPVRIGIAGCGRGGTQVMYAPILRYLETGQVTALVDPDPAALAAMQPHCPAAATFSDYDAFLAEAEMGRASGSKVAPHNWGSLFGYYLQLQVGRAIPNFYMAEQDPMSCRSVIAEGYEIKNGESSVPDTPGLGLRLNDEALAEEACVHFDLKA